MLLQIYNENRNYGQRTMFIISLAINLLYDEIRSNYVELLSDSYKTH